jgi:hypothetical protein
MMAARCRVRARAGLWGMGAAAMVTAIAACGGGSTEDAKPSVEAGENAPHASAAAPPSDEDEAPGSCPFPASECPAGCEPIQGFELAPGADCKAPLVVGCTADEVLSSMPACVKHVEDGSLYFVAAYSVPERADWPPCTEAEIARLNEALVCE